MFDSTLENIQRVTDWKSGLRCSSREEFSTEAFCGQYRAHRRQYIVPAESESVFQLIFPNFAGLFIVEAQNVFGVLSQLCGVSNEAHSNNAGSTVSRKQEHSLSASRLSVP